MGETDKFLSDITCRPNTTVLVIGGGLAGLITSLLLNRKGISVILVEKKRFPFHRVCGEYISNEVSLFFKSLGISLEEFEPSKISRLAISSLSGKVFSDKLDLGGFGISRYTLDEYLYKKAKAEGVQFILGEKVNKVTFGNDMFESFISNGSSIFSRFAVAAYGKRSNLDKQRSFFYHRSPYIGVKYHIRTEFPSDLIQLDNFEGGYCGTVKVDGGRYNLCYLSRTENLRKTGSVKAMEEEVLYKNPYIKDIFSQSDFLFAKPEVINEISFEKKSLVENHLLYCGDAAGMISPLCGNGMAMAIHSAKILSETISDCRNLERIKLEQTYINRWNKSFSQRLAVGRMAQILFGKKFLSELAVAGLRNMKPLSNLIVKHTHGTSF